MQLSVISSRLPWFVVLQNTEKLEVIHAGKEQEDFIRSYFQAFGAVKGLIILILVALSSSALEKFAISRVVNH